MTFIESFSSQPKSVILRGTKNKKINLIIHGQGVFLFQTQENTQGCSFNIYDNEEKTGLKIELNESAVKINKLPSLEPLFDTNNKCGLTTKKGAYYWLSIDSQNQKLQVGIGEARIENAIYQYSFPFTDNKERKQNKSFLEGLTMIDLSMTTVSEVQSLIVAGGSLQNSIVPLQLLRDPITNKIPLLIKNTNDLTMKHIAKATYLPKSHLSSIAQQLYDCISGKKFVLNDASFPDFSKAIEYSIATPGLWCYEKLKEKSTEFDKENPNVLETYLRITLNQNNGESPGIPYVMEIWPPKHFSPVHNHSGANAIIRVLHGKINVKLFSFLCDEKDSIEPFNEVQFVKDDITWISPTLNQVHQLTNLETNKNTCITIQCYMYDEIDKTHYDYFDYLDSNGNKEKYEPDSDMEFIAFKETIKEEWKKRPRCLKRFCKKYFSFGKC
jgi:predicted metal-dependent enzyme (double-stranded beta helix superfamily)